MNASKTISYTGWSISSDKLRKLLSSIPADAELHIEEHAGDRPFESGYVTIEASWEEEE